MKNEKRGAFSQFRVFLLFAEFLINNSMENTNKIRIIFELSVFTLFSYFPIFSIFLLRSPIYILIIGLTIKTMLSML